VPTDKLPCGRAIGAIKALRERVEDAIKCCEQIIRHSEQMPDDADPFDPDEEYTFTYEDGLRTVAQVVVDMLRGLEAATAKEQSDERF